MRIFYRISQFWRALFDKPTSDDLALAQEILPPPLMALFKRQSLGEQAHSISILRRLCEQGHMHEDLLCAALLHDVGKSRYPLHLWERVLIVMAKALFPKRVKTWGAGKPESWNKSFVVAEQHAAWGAEMAEQAGASVLTVALIRRHQEALNAHLMVNGNSTKKVVVIDQIEEVDPPSLEDKLLYQLIIHDNES